MGGAIFGRSTILEELVETAEEEADVEVDRKGLLCLLETSGDKGTIFSG
jgi:hypothetical protein